jgi:16S rRNA (guanine527-N7)-methyltransferase
MVKRTEFLREVLAQDGAPGSGSVVMARAEDLAREEPYEEAFSLVTARSFGPPSVVAECAVRFLRSGGMLVVSEPPDDEDVTRWNPKGLEKLGLQDLGRVRKGAAYRVLRKIHTTPREFPRAVGIPKKSPLF